MEIITQELIKHAAVKAENGWVFIGKNHADCLHKIFNLGLKGKKGGENQGFVTNHGRYLERFEAGKLAFENGQIKKETTMLFSEDLWCPTYNGKHTYDEVMGYQEISDGCDNV